MSSIPQQMAFADHAIHPVSVGFIEVSGNAKTFLQGQLSCDMQAVSPTMSGIGAHCNANGTVQAFFRVCQLDGERYLLVMPESIVAKALQTLNKYAFFADCHLSLKKDYAALALHGAAAYQQLTALYATVPAQDYQQLSIDGGLIVCTSSHWQSYEIYVEKDRFLKICEHLQIDAEKTDNRQKQLLEHQLGLAFIEAPLSGGLFVHNLNYQKTLAVSLNKGCYTGQEIIARTHYKGSVKRKLYHCQLSAQELTLGEPLFLQGKACGTVISAIAIAEGRFDALLLLADNALDAPLLESSAGLLSHIENMALAY